MSEATVVLPPSPPDGEPERQPEGPAYAMRKVMLAKRMGLQWSDGDITGVYGPGNEVRLEQYEPGEIEIPEPVYLLHERYIRAHELGYKAPAMEDVRGTVEWAQKHGRGPQIYTRDKV
ncbi:MAG: hypothetical protein JOY71_10150 [Acetobacteraceae bacterium]|nr:hypothetical protein [Acetobacteraceae bacterium]MBV8522465.1 hypothetical protein [Acetobacteraceae bacterium]